MRNVLHSISVGPCPPARVFDRALRCVPHRKDVIAVDDFSGHAVGRCAVGNIFHGHLPFQRRRVGVLVVVADKHDRAFHDGRHVQAFVPVSAAGGAIAERAHHHAVLAAHFERQADSGRHRNVVSQHADKGDEVMLQTAHVHVGVFALGRSGLLAHVLGEYGSQRHAANQECSHIPMRRTNDVVGPKVDAAADRDGLLAAADIDAADNLALPVELALDAVLQLADNLHVIEDFELRLSRRERRALSHGECVRIHRFRVHLLF